MTLPVTFKTEQRWLIIAEVDTEVESEVETEVEIAEDEAVESETSSTTGILHKLVLWNDDFNTFEHVIACMIKFIKKTQDEAAEIAYTVHTKGKCIIVIAPKHELIELYHILLLKKLTVSIE